MKTSDQIFQNPHLDGALKALFVPQVRRLEDTLNQIQNILRDPFPESIYPQLSPLERDIAKMTVIDGMTARQVSKALDSPIGTVNTYLRMVYKALGVTRNSWPKLLFDRIREVLKE